MKQNELKHFGILGMRWGHRKAQSVGGGNLVGKPVKTLLGTRTEAVYDKQGNDISSKPFKRIGKEKGQSDKDFDKMVNEEMNPKPEKLVGKPVKTLFGTRTEAVYDKQGNDISSKPFGRPFKKKGQSDKDYDKEIDDENSDAPDAIARRKVADLEMDREAKIQFAVSMAVAGGIGLAMYAGQKQLQKAAEANLVSKYGPVLAEMIKKGQIH
jgi:hypothetical protein